MTERMENTLRHIKTSVDVDPWAVDEVERVFKAVEDIKTEIEKPLREERFFDTDTAKAQAIALKWCLEIIDKHISGEEQERSNKE